MMKRGKKQGEIGRRDFLALSGTAIAGVCLAPLLGGCDTHLVTPFGESGDVATFLTPVERFFVQNGGEGGIGGWSQPNFPTESAWSMTVKNGTDEKVVTWDDLTRIAAESGEVSQLKTIECVLQSDVRTTLTGYAGTAYWSGVPLLTVLESVGLDTSEEGNVKALILQGSDRFVNNITTERLHDPNLLAPILATRMNGESLPREHGFPVRLIIQEGYGYKCVKWLTKVETSSVLTDVGTYQSQGYVNDGIIRPNSRSTSLFDNIAVNAGPTMITGFATGGFAPIERVEISIDDGPAQEARIVPIEELTAGLNLPPNIEQIAAGGYPFLGVWTFWDLEWEAPSGAHTIAIRAFDSEGNAQPLVDEDQSDGLTGVTTYRVEVG